MTSTELLTLFRQEVDDIATPYLWSDDEAFEYMTDAQRWFCRKTEGIADSRTASVCTLTSIIGQEWYALSPLILKLRRVTRGDTGREVSVVNPESLNRYDIRWDGNASGIKALVVGLSDGAVRIWPKPSEAVVMTLEVFRLPLEAITSYDQPFEINEQHHRHLVMWMAHLAYGKKDADTYDGKQSAEYEAAFNNYCFKALAEQERARRQVGVTRYGGI